MKNELSEAESPFTSEYMQTPAVGLLERINYYYLSNYCLSIFFLKCEGEITSLFKSSEKTNSEWMDGLVLRDRKDEKFRRGASIPRGDGGGGWILQLSLRNSRQQGASSQQN